VDREGGQSLVCSQETTPTNQKPASNDRWPAKGSNQGQTEGQTEGQTVGCASPTVFRARQG
jgi:hypothetical protein